MSFVPIQIRDKEQASLDLLKPAVETALHEAEVKLEIPSSYTGVTGFYDHNLKINKIAYAAIEEFDLPLLRTWYRYGQFEPYDQLRPKSLNIGDNSRDAYVPSSLKTDVTQGRIVKYLLNRGLEATFEQPLFDFLIENYKQWEPEPYEDAYVASTRIIRALENINEANQGKILANISGLRRDVKQASIDLRYQFNSIRTFESPLQNHIEAYLSDLEHTLMKIDETSELGSNQVETLQQSRNVYHESVWPWAAINISIDKARGPENSLPGFRESGKAMLDDRKRSYQTHLKGWRASLKEEDFKPSFESYKKAVRPTPEAIQNLQKAAHRNN